MFPLLGLVPCIPEDNKIKKISFNPVVRFRLIDKCTDIESFWSEDSLYFFKYREALKLLLKNNFNPLPNIPQPRGNTKKKYYSKKKVKS